ncbi:twin-arginine translocation signal domain-containing protein, partial [Campylobacter concisus]
MKEISRRNFMKMGATGALALAASSANAGVLEAKDIKFDEEYDVIV